MKTVSIAECATCGNVMAKFGSISGSSNYYRGGLVTYNIEQKIQLLGVERQHAENFDCVSEKVVEEMASGIAKLYNTDIGISTSGYAEVYPKKNIKKPFIYICIHDRVTGKTFIDKINNDENHPRTKFQKYVANKIHNIYIDSFSN